MLGVLSQYLSKVNTGLALDRALARADLTPASLDEQHISTVIPHLERSLNLFVERGRLPRLLGDLRAQAAPPSVEACTVLLTCEADLSEARLVARKMCQDLGAPSLVQQKVITLVSELARNIVLYAERGHLDLAPQVEPHKLILVRARDEGPGIVNLDQILAGQYKSKTGLGMGLRGCKRMADRFAIETGNWGTRVEAEIRV
jgi:serine/threonine-protein kinase RsbT